MCVACFQREEAREGTRRAVEAAWRDGDQPQAAAARQVMPHTSLQVLDNAIHFIFTYVFIFYSITFLLMMLLIFYTSNDLFVRAHPPGGVRPGRCAMQHLDTRQRVTRRTMTSM